MFRLPLSLGVPRLSSSASVTVIVENVNDVAPRFVNVPSDCIDVEETRGVGLTVFILRVEDADSTEFNFNITDGQDESK